MMENETNVLESTVVAEKYGPVESAFRLVDALYELLARDATFARVRRLMEVDWSEADVTVEEIGLPRLMQNQAQKLWALFDGRGDSGIDWSDLADAIRYTERHDTVARDALWWLGQLASDPLLQGRRRGGSRR